jgi:hypothetical protein
MSPDVPLTEWTNGRGAGEGRALLAIEKRLVMTKRVENCASRINFVG